MGYKGLSEGPYTRWSQDSNRMPVTTGNVSGVHVGWHISPSHLDSMSRLISSRLGRLLWSPKELWEQPVEFSLKYCFYLVWVFLNQMHDIQIEFDFYMNSNVIALKTSPWLQQDVALDMTSGSNHSIIAFEQSLHLFLSRMCKCHGNVTRMHY